MNLPQNVRREAVIDQNPDTWMYADSYVGKSTFWDSYDDLLFANTDGNTDNTTSPVVRIKDEVTVTGRVTNKKWAWENFEELVSELEKQYVAGTLEFKHLALDLVEDLYEHCRLKVYDENGWQHESDGGYGKGYDMVRVRFTSTMKRLKNIGIHIIYISKEVKETVTPKNGNAYNTFRPNIQEKIANMLAGTVDLTVRAYVEGESRYIQLQKTDTEFGGGRFNFKAKRCELSKEAFTNALKEAQAGKKIKVEEPKAPVEVQEEEISVDVTPTEDKEQQIDTAPPEGDKPKRGRRTRKTE